MKQSRRMSLVEARRQRRRRLRRRGRHAGRGVPDLRAAASLAQNLGIGAVFTVVSLIRGYALRRLFEALGREEPSSIRRRRRRGRTPRARPARSGHSRSSTARGRADVLAMRVVPLRGDRRLRGVLDHVIAWIDARTRLAGGHGGRGRAQIASSTRARGSGADVLSSAGGVGDPAAVERGQVVVIIGSRRSSAAPMLVAIQWIRQSIRCFPLAESRRPAAAAGARGRAI